MNSPLAMLPLLLKKAQSSAADLRLLNRLLGKAIPFNAPHGFEIESVGEDFVRTRAPYRTENLNHIEGIHACAIATIAEFSSGLLLLARLNPAEFRLIMARLEIDYHYQAKTDLIAEAVLSAAQLESEILAPLQTADALIRTMETKVQDTAGNPVATARVTWQIKAWASVRTRIA